MNKKKRRSWFNMHPWLPTLLTIGYIILGLLAAVIMIYNPSLGKTMPKFFPLVSFLLSSGPIVLAILQILNFRRSITSIRGLAILYLEIILMFGVIYFYAVSDKKALSHSNELTDSTLVIRGINADWASQVKLGDIADKKEVLVNMLECFHDSVYFSLITSTTVGYGDMVPVSFLAKSLVDIQVIVSFFLISFGVAYFSSTHKEKSKKMEIADIKLRLEALENRNNNDNSPSHKSDLS